MMRNDLLSPTEIEALDIEPGRFGEIPLSERQFLRLKATALAAYSPSGKLWSDVAAREHGQVMLDKVRLAELDALQAESTEIISAQELRIAAMEAENGRLRASLRWGTGPMDLYNFERWRSDALTLLQPEEQSNGN